MFLFFSSISRRSRSVRQDGMIVFLNIGPFIEGKYVPNIIKNKLKRFKILKNNECTIIGFKIVHMTFNNQSFCFSAINLIWIFYELTVNLGLLGRSPGYRKRLSIERL